MDTALYSSAALPEACSALPDRLSKCCPCGPCTPWPPRAGKVLRLQWPPCRRSAGLHWVPMHRRYPVSPRRCAARVQKEARRAWLWQERTPARLEEPARATKPECKTESAIEPEHPA